MKYLKGFVLGLAIVVGVQFVSAAWTDPSATPPGNNTDTPLNVALSQQDKLGSLFLNTDTSNPYAIGLGVFGKSVFNGSVQIVDGTQHAGYVLTSDGNGNASWQPPQQATNSTTTVTNNNNSGPVIFATPVKVTDDYSPYSSPNAWGPWTTFDMSSYVPSTDKSIILAVGCTPASDAGTNYPASINVRNTASSPSQSVCSNNPGSWNGASGWYLYPSQQVTVALTGGSFQWQGQGGYDSIAIVGYNQ